MSMAIDGLASGLNTTELINSLMRLEAAPQTLLKSKSSEASKLVSAFQALNTTVASLAETAAKAARSSSWDVLAATSSSDAVTAAVAVGAQPATLQLRVDALAAGQVAMIDLGSATELSITRAGAAAPTTFSGSLDDIAAAVNADEALGVAAVKVRIGTGTDGEPLFRLQLNGAPGAQNAFDVDVAGARVVDGTAAEGTATAPLVAASDAQITLWPGSTGVAVTSTNNTFTDLLPGVSLTVSRAGAETVTLGVEPDDDAMRALVSDVIGSVGVVLSEITSRTATTTTTGDDGRTVVSGGLFSGDSTVRTLADQIRSAVSMPVGGLSPSAIGINLDRSGEITFDQEAFDKAMAEDPAGTRAMAMTIAGRVADVAESSSDPIDGTLSLVVKSHEGLVSDLNRQIEDWDRRLELRRATLERTYAALEVTLSNLQAQSTWLAGQLATFPTSSSRNG